MNIYIALAVAALVTTLTAVAQDARDIASQMGANTTSSVSAGKTGMASTKTRKPWEHSHNKLRIY